MNSDTSSMPDIEEYMAAFCDQNGMADKRMLNASTSCNNDGSSDEIEIVKELKVNLEKHECDLCCEGTFLVNKLLQFGGILNDTYKHACEICNTGFKTKADVKNHKKLHEDGFLSDEPSFQDLSSLLNSHDISASTPSSSRKKRKNLSAPVVCDVCYKILKSERTLETHKRNQHSNIIFSCEVCGAKFSKFQAFKKHCATHKDSTKFITCPTCNKQFLYKDSLKKHVCALKT